VNLKDTGARAGPETLPIGAICSLRLAYAAVRRSSISNNSVGVWAQSTSTIRLSQCQITGNATGWFTNGAGSVTSTADNMIDDNPNGNGGPPAVECK
jgi:nitrous oxidase accessory protein NosD